jgi:hypothetical protein
MIYSSTFLAPQLLVYGPGLCSEVVPSHVTMPEPPPGSLTFDPGYDVSHSVSDTITNLLVGNFTSSVLTPNKCCCMYFRLLVEKIGYLKNVTVFNNFEKITKVAKY